MDGFAHFVWQTHRLSPHRLAAPISLGPRLSTRLGTWAQELLQWTRAPRKAPEPCWSTAALEWWTAPRAHLHHRGDTSQCAMGQLHFNSLCMILRPDCTALTPLLQESTIAIQYLKSKTHPNTQCQCDFLLSIAINDYIVFVLKSIQRNRPAGIMMNSLDSVPISLEAVQL